MARPNLTAQRVRELLDYNPDTGAFVWRISLGGIARGSVAGCVAKRGNWQISADGRRHKAHRLAWLWMTGEWPTHEVDHRDGNPLNNRWGNLRAATGAQNKQNQRRPRIDNRSGFLGVYRHATAEDGSPIWRARIQLNGKSHHVGLFSDPAKAHAAYVEAKRRLHPFGTL